MVGSRRDFIKAGTAISLLVVSPKSADAATKGGRKTTKPAKKIGIIHSTIWAPNFDACFKKGLDAGGFKVDSALKPQAANGKYNGASDKHDTLKKFIKDHVKGNPDILVAAGGNVSAKATSEALADEKSNKRFVFLSGSLPVGSPLAGSAGGIVLDTPMQNKARADKLATDFRIDPTRVFLFQNANSEMAGSSSADPNTEAAVWGNDATIHKCFVGANNPTTDSSKLLTAAIEAEVQMLRGKSPAGLVVSADPFFRFVRSTLVPALRALNIPVCFPLPDYLEVAHPSNFIWLGPKLAVPGSAGVESTAYYQLGLRVADHIKNSADTRIKRWNGSDWAFMT